MGTESVSASDAAADAALALELVARFFGNQIDAGAVTREEIARHVHDCAAAVGAREPALASRVQVQAVRIVDGLPAGWAEGDGDWQEPA